MKIKAIISALTLILTGCSINPQFINTPATPVPELSNGSKAQLGVQPTVKVVTITVPAHFSKVHARKTKPKTKKSLCTPCKPIYHPNRTKPKITAITKPFVPAKPRLIRTEATIPPLPYFSKEEAQDSTLVQQKLIDYIKVLKDELKKQQ